MLTDRFVRSAKTGMYADEGGLYLQVYASGTKAFLHRTQTGGKPTKTVLGHYPAMGLAEARDALAKRKSGRATYTVASAFEEYYQHIAPKYKDPGKIRRFFDKDVLPTVGDKPLGELTTIDITNLCRAVVKRGSPTSANKVLVNTKGFLRYCEQLGWIDRNPIAATTKAAIGGKERPRSRNLSFDEITEFLKLLMDASNQMSTRVRWTLYLCLLTGQRISEVLSFKLGSNPWLEGPAKSNKNAPLTYKVPLTVEVRAAMKFYTTRPGRLNAVSEALRFRGKDFTPHDLRRTMASRMADLGVAPHVVEKLLNHRMAGVMATYNRAEYWPERVEAQRLWGKTLRSLRHKARGLPSC